MIPRGAYRVAFAAGIAVLTLGFGAGLLHAWRDGRTLPRLTFDNLVEIEQLLAERDYQRAIHQLQMTLDFVPSNRHLTLNLLGNALEASGRLDEAAERYAEALRIRPDYPEAHNNLGVIHARQGRLDQATDQFLAALQHKPDFDEARRNLGLTAGRLQATLQRDPSDGQARRDLERIGQALGQRAPAGGNTGERSAEAQATLSAGRRAADGFLAGDLDGLHARFSPGFGQRMTLESLRALHRDVALQLGPQQAVVSEERRVQDGLEIYRRVARFERMDGDVEVLVGFDDDWRIEGLLLRPVALPPP